MLGWTRSEEAVCSLRKTDGRMDGMTESRMRSSKSSNFDSMHWAMNGLLLQRQNISFCSAKPSELRSSIDCVTPRPPQRELQPPASRVPELQPCPGPRRLWQAASDAQCHIRPMIAVLQMQHHSLSTFPDVFMSLPSENSDVDTVPRHTTVRPPSAQRSHGFE